MNEQERNDWIKVAEFWVDVLLEQPGRTSFYVNGRKFYIEEEPAQAMLHGLACLRCNGCVWRDKDWEWCWDSYQDDGSMIDHGEEKSHPSALLAMLEAHEEAQR